MQFETRGTKRGMTIMMTSSVQNRSTVDRIAVFLERALAGGAVPVSELEQRARFELAKAFHPVLLDHVLAALPGAPLDLAIELDNRCAEVPRERRRD